MRWPRGPGQYQSQTTQKKKRNQSAVSQSPREQTQTRWDHVDAQVQAAASATFALSPWADRDAVCPKHSPGGGCPAATTAPMSVRPYPRPGGAPPHRRCSHLPLPGERTAQRLASRWLHWGGIRRTSADAGACRNTGLLRNARHQGPRAPTLPHARTFGAGRGHCHRVLVSAEFRRELWL